MRFSFGYAAAAMVSLALAGCGSSGGGSTGSGGTALAAPLPATVTSATGTVTLSVTIPAVGAAPQSSAARAPQYISPSSTDFYVVLASLNSVAQTGVGGLVYAHDLSTATAGACSGSGSSRACTWTLANVPAGTDVLEILEAATASNVASPLAYGLSGSIVVTSGATASANVTLAGIVNSAALSAGVLNGALQLGIDTSLSDAGGNAVSGTFENPVAVASTGGLSALILNGLAGANNVQITKATDALSVGAVVGTLALTATPSAFTTPAEFARDFAPVTFDNAGGSASSPFNLTCALGLGCSAAQSGSIDLGVN